MMRINYRKIILAATLAALVAMPAVAGAEPFTQCPDPDPGRDIQCQHVAAGDGFVKMADGREIYTFASPM